MDCTIVTGMAVTGRNMSTIFVYSMMNRRLSTNNALFWPVTITSEIGFIVTAIITTYNKGRASCSIVIWLPHCWTIICRCVMCILYLQWLKHKFFFSKPQYLPAKPQLVPHVPASNPMLQLKPHMPQVNNSLKYTKNLENQSFLKFLLFLPDFFTPPMSAWRTHWFPPRPWKTWRCLRTLLGLVKNLDHAQMYRYHVNRINIYI